MDEQHQSFDGLLQLNQDFCVPDQLFEDSDVGVEDVYNTIEIETSETDMGKDDCTRISSQPAKKTQLPSCQLPSSQSPLATMKNCVNKQDACSGVSTTLVCETPMIQSRLPTTISSGNQMSIPSATPMVTKTTVPLAVPAAVSLAAPTKHTPLKMVSVPINSDVITQGNSQVVLIPMGGMDSMKLETTLKVPEGQKLVIIKPQEILKTIEQKKSQKNSAQNLTLSQHGILLQSPGGVQQIPQVSLTAGHPDSKGLVRLTVPQTLVPQSVSVPQNVQHVTVPSNSIRPQPIQSLSPQQKLQVPRPTMVQIQPKPIQVPNSSGSVMKTNVTQPGVAVKLAPKTTAQSAAVGSMLQPAQPRILTSTANNKGITHSVGPTHKPAPNTIQLSQNSKSSNQIRNTALADQTTSQSSLTTSQTSVTASQTGLTTSQTSLTKSQTSLTKSQTGLTTFQTGVTTSQTGLTTSQNARSDATPNVYQTIKQKPKEESSAQNSTASGNAKPDENMPSNAEATEEVKSNASLVKTSEKEVVITYVPSDKPAKIVQKKIVTTDKRNDAHILGPNKGHDDGTANETISQPANGLQPANDQQPANGQQPANPKTVPKISSPVSKTKNSEIKVERSIEAVPSLSDAPSTSQETEQTFITIQKRGRPRKNDPAPLLGPTLKHELDRPGHSPGKTWKVNQPQMKAVKHKRVSNTNPWTCALCGKVSFENSLGCLYGPYDGGVGKEDRAVGHLVSEGGEPHAKKRRGSNEDELDEELWFHGDCIVWSPGVYAMAESLGGYHQVVADAQSRNCDYCGNTGATLVCLQRTCKKQFHYFCAKKTRCVFDESNYTIQCRKHVK